MTADAAAALELVEGPIHAELRTDGGRAWVLELAARSIGGLGSRPLRFGVGVTLEEVILRHALGLPIDDLRRESAASGVMMIPIPQAGILEDVRGQDRARAVPGIAGLELTIGPGRHVMPCLRATDTSASSSLGPTVPRGSRTRSAPRRANWRSCSAHMDDHLRVR